jgi:hypothetical protein
MSIVSCSVNQQCEGANQLGKPVSLPPTWDHQTAKLLWHIGKSFSNIWQGNERVIVKGFIVYLLIYMYHNMYILCSMVILFLNMENETHVTKVNTQKQTYYMLNRTCELKMWIELILTSCHDWQHTFHTTEPTFAYLVRALPKKKKKEWQTTFIQVISTGRILLTRYEAFRHIAHVYKLDVQT